MEPSQSSRPSAFAPDTADPRYCCGTLTYTKSGLFRLFGFLLWGDFCFSFMEVVWGSVLLLVLKSHGASNTVISVVLTIIPYVMNAILNPIISTASDRYRSKRGRRIPFLLFSAPFISFFLILMGFSNELGALLYPWIGGLSPVITKVGVTIGLICVLIVSFRFFELFVATVFWYLFNDVVPEAFMGRFLGMFRVISALAGVLFNYFILQYAESHTREIFFGAGILYGLGFLLLSLNVKEGSYPPPEKMSQKKGFSLEVVATFFRECFSHRIYRLVFLNSLSNGMAGAISGFSLFMMMSLGLTLADIGKVAALSGVVGMVLLYPMGTLADRFHPLRIVLPAQTAFALVTAVSCIFLFVNFSREGAFWIVALLSATTAVVLAANTAALLPMYMHIFPRERFGQFCAANAMCGSIGLVVAGALGGLFLDVLKKVFSSRGDYYYRFVPVWSFLFLAFAAFALWLVFKEWKRLGGIRGYVPPGSSMKPKEPLIS